MHKHHIKKTLRSSTGTQGTQSRRPAVPPCELHLQRYPSEHKANCWPTLRGCMALAGHHWSEFRPNIAASCHPGFMSDTMEISTRASYTDACWKVQRWASGRRRGGWRESFYCLKMTKPIDDRLSQHAKQAASRKTSLGLLCGSQRDTGLIRAQS